MKEKYDGFGWLILFHIIALVCFVAIDWKLGLGWLSWRVGHLYFLDWKEHLDAQEEEPTPPTSPQPSTPAYESSDSFFVPPPT